jgi:N-acetyltransferase 10
MDGLSRGLRAGGDMIPWLVSQQFQESKFALLSGARIVRIATHPDYANVSHLQCILACNSLADQMGYGSRALKALNSFYSGEYFNLDEATSAEPSYPDASALDPVNTKFVSDIYVK